MSVHQSTNAMVWLGALSCVFLWVSPAVTASPYGKTVASSGAAVICGGTPLVMQTLLGLSVAHEQQHFQFLVSVFSLIFMVIYVKAAIN